MGGPEPDPWLTDRVRADLGLVKAEQRIEEAVTRAIAEWLEVARALVLRGRENMPGNIPATVTAAADFFLDIDAIQASFDAWQAGLQNHVEPAISEAFGAGFGGSARSAEISPLPYAERHIRDVHDRLRMWPENAWEDMRPELQQIVARSGTIEQASDQVATILDINAPSRALRAQIAEVDDALAAAESPGEIRTLRARRRELWDQHDRSLGEWQMYARRIARTEVQGAVEGGALASAEAISQATGQRMFKQWLATKDSRCRRTHKLADGQIVPIGEKFRVGRADLDHPAAPGGPAEEVIHCRCTMKILSEDEVAQALASERGRRGVRPQSYRMGPDDQSAIDMAQDLMRREERGEEVEWPDPTPPAPEAPKRRARPGDEFRGASLDDLGQRAADAIEAEDWDLLDRIAAEENRRQQANAASRARRATQREAREAQQMQHYERLLADGVDDEEAVEAAFGISIERQRRTNAINFLRGLGYQGAGIDELVRAWFRDEVYQAALRAENDLNGYLLTPRAQAAGQVSFTDLWTMPEAQAMRHASEELRGWWDENGRVTVAELKAQLLDPAELNRIMSGRRDYLQ